MYKMSTYNNYTTIIYVEGWVIDNKGLCVLKYEMYSRVSRLVILREKTASMQVELREVEIKMSYR